MAGIFGSQAPASQGIQAATGMRVQTALYGIAVPLMWGTVRVPINVLWYGDFVASAQSQSAGGKGGGGTITTGYTYQAALAMALGEGPVQDVLRVWVDKAINTPAQLGLTLLDGGPGQAPWGYLTTYHPDEALVYPGLAYLATGSYKLGANPDLSNHTAEVLAQFGTVPQPDANPRQVLQDFLTNARYGVPGFTLAMLDGLDEYEAYCEGQGLRVSPLWAESKPAADYLTHLLHITNTDAVPSQGRLRLMPRTSRASVFAIAADELMAPVKRTTSPASASTDDAYNLVRIECLNRDFDYNVDVLTAADGVNIDAYGRRELATIQAHEFCSPEAAQRAAQLILQRGLWTRQRYEAKVGIQRALLEPGDVGSLPYRGRDVPVRILQTQRQGELISLSCEEYVDDGGDVTGLSASGGGGYGADWNTPPGPTATPLLVNAFDWLTGGAAQLWLAVTGSGNWGGVTIYVSLDGTTYRRVGSTRLRARYGTLRSALAAPSADPDVSNTLQVQLVDTTLDLADANAADAQANQTLCVIDTELLAYAHSTMVGSGQFDLTTLYRGRKSTATAAHSSGANFLRVDSAVYRYTYDKALIGSTVYVKLAAFNVYGGAEQDLASVTAYSITLGPVAPPPGTPPPPDYIPADTGD